MSIQITDEMLFAQINETLSNKETMEEINRLTEERMEEEKASEKHNQITYVESIYASAVARARAKAIEKGERLIYLHQKQIIYLKEGDVKRYEYTLTLIADEEKQLEEAEADIARHQSNLAIEKLKSERYQTRHVLRQISLLKEEQDRVWNSVERCWQCERTETLDGWVTYEGKEGQHCGYCCDEDGEPLVTCECCEWSLYTEKDMKMIEPGVWEMCLTCWEDTHKDEEGNDGDAWYCCKCKTDGLKEDEVEHIDELDDSVCLVCCEKYGLKTEDE